MKDQAIQAFSGRFGISPTVISRAPGRLEILGNHTDYNCGTVLSTAVDRYIYMTAAPAQGDVCTLWDLDLKEERSFNINAVEEHTPGDWSNYIKGMIVELRRRGINVPAFNAVIVGDVPLSAGMSSSAALEMATGKALCGLAGTELSWLDMAKAGQACENNYVGAKTGLLDQFSSLRGQAGHLVYSDFRTLNTAVIPIPAGTAFVVVNCMVKHTLTNEYNDRRASCENAVICLARRTKGISSLRDVPLNLLMNTRKRIKETSFDCAAHVIGEIIRVAEGIRALDENNLEEFGRLMFQSHDSSRYLFKNSCPELDTLVDIARVTPGCIGARLSGGGFGGISVHLVKSEMAEDYAKAVALAYKEKTGIEPQTILCSSADGACILD